MRETILKNKIALVTGASSGIGEAISLELAKSGALLYLIGRNESKLCEVKRKALQYTSFIQIIKADVTSSRDLNRTYEIISNQHELDILVHSAGYFTRSSVEETEESGLRQALESNFIGPYLLTKLFIRHLKKTRGHIILLNSTAGVENFPEHAAYCSSKHALKAFADILRQELSKYLVRVSSVYPARTATPMQEKVVAAENPATIYNPDIYAQAEDIADTVMHILKQPQQVEIADIRFFTKYI
jgi:NADP-dependent 3-hydroxy acid dehydrogenase YdfG